MRWDKDGPGSNLAEGAAEEGDGESQAAGGAGQEISVSDLSATDSTASLITVDNEQEEAESSDTSLPKTQPNLKRTASEVLQPQRRRKGLSLVHTVSLWSSSEQSSPNQCFFLGIALQSTPLRKCRHCLPEERHDCMGILKLDAFTYLNIF